MRILELSGGVGGARLARGLAALPGVELTVIVNVGDDADNHGLRVCPDLDTVTYTLAGMEGPHGWGRANDTFHLNDELARFDVDNTFQLGDRDLALKLFRTNALAAGDALSTVTRVIADSFGITANVVPATDDRLRTRVRIREGWVSFQEYFVARQYRDEVLELEFDGADASRPAPGVIEAVTGADQVIIGPSNPPLSIWPVLAVPGIREALMSHPAVTAVSPLIAGQAVKGPTASVMSSLGLAPSNDGVAAAYEGLVDRLVVDTVDRDAATSTGGVDVVVADTLITEPAASARLARTLVGS